MPDKLYSGQMFDPRASRSERNRVFAHTPVEDSLGPVPAWSFSVLQDFEECPHRVQLAKVKKVEQDRGPAANRGNVVHEGAERYIQGKTNHPRDGIPSEDLGKPGNKLFNAQMPLLDKLRERYAKGEVEVEQQWGFDLHWQSTGYFDKNIWARMKLDVLHHESETSAYMIDWKTGRKFGNELKHGSQGICYAVGAFNRYPALEHLTCEFNYLDHDQTFAKVFTRQRTHFLQKRLTERAMKLTTAKVFPPKPSKKACKYCPVKAHCEYVDPAVLPQET